MSFYSHYIKRPIDFLTALLLLIGLSWLLVLIVVAYVLSGEASSVFFVQERIGRFNRPFRMIKFRTLSTNVNATLQERTFRLGSVLRFLSLDELPQLINILRGEMSIVGPRPLPMEYLPLMSAEQTHRHDVLPGVTGWTQVNGRHSISWQEKFALDVYYVSHQSFVLDIQILFRTAALWFSFRRDQSLTEQKFQGNSTSTEKK